MMSRRREDDYDAFARAIYIPVRADIIAQKEKIGKLPPVCGKRGEEGHGES